MSCYPELTYALYADGELTGDEARPLESHLVQCLPCRERIVALREESEAIGNALLDRTPELTDWHPRPTPARGLVLGMGPAVAAGVAITLAAGWVFEAVRPAGFEWVSPWSFKGATDMGLDLIFLLRDDAPAVFEVAVALAAMASVSALLTFSLTVVLRRWNGPSLLSLGAILALLVSAGDSQAHFGLHRHENFDLAQDEVHDGTLIASGGVVNLDGKVAGDAFVLAEQLTVRGEIGGNLDAALPEGSEITVRDGAKIRGELTTRVQDFDPRGRRFARYTQARFYMWLVLHLTASFAVGMLLHALLPGMFRVSSRRRVRLSGRWPSVSWWWSRCRSRCSPLPARWWASPWHSSGSACTWRRSTSEASLSPL